MPIYEYECSSCHHKFDVLQKINDEPVKACPACNSDTAIKLVSAAGFQLKGTGWYATDFKDKTIKKSEGSAKGSTVKKTESKPAESSEASAATKKGESD